jgi:2-polyprenyl-6-methoxyphenol hydroxylase-like FAD-dependent oxidoreductase
MADNRPNVVIVGAGIGGLAAAIALKNAGLEVLVLERVAQLKPVGSGITLQTNALQALDYIGLSESVRQNGAELTHAMFCLEDGKQILEADMARFADELGQPTVCIHRGILQWLLLNKLGRRHVRAGVRLLRITQDRDAVRLDLSGGERIIADAVIGADGIRSFVRSQLWGQIELRHAGYTSWRGVCRNDGLVAPGEANETWGTARRFGFMPMDDERLYWFATESALPDSKEHDSTQSAMVRRFGSWHGPIGQIVRLTPSTEILQTDVYELPRLKAWGHGRITLLGDAAHAMTPNLGQGGGMALEDAVVLAEAYRGKPTVKDWFLDFAHRRKRRTRAIADESRRLGALAQGRTAVSRFIRNRLLPLIPGAMHDAHMRQLLKFSGLPALPSR